MRRNILLGLLVFVVGVFITSCGSKSSGGGSDSTANDTIYPTDYNNYSHSCANCSMSSSGSFIVDNDDLYLDAFDYGESNVSNAYTDNPITNLFAQILITAADNKLNGYICDGVHYLDKWAAGKDGYTESECTFEGGLLSQSLGFSEDYDVADAYGCNMTFYYDGNRRIRAIDMRVASGLDEDSSYDRMRFTVDDNDRNYFSSADGRNGLVYDQYDKTYRMVTNTGKVIGHWGN